MLGNILGPEKDEVTGDWRRFHNEEFQDLYSSPHTIWVIKSTSTIWAGQVACMGGGERGAYRVLVVKRVGKTPLGRSRHKWVDDI